MPSAHSPEGGEALAGDWLQSACLALAAATVLPAKAELPNVPHVLSSAEDGQASISPARPDCAPGRSCVTLTGAQVLEVARSLFAARRFEEARGALKALEASGELREERIFLEGLIALETGDHDGAIRRFRQLLQENPNLVRVRLELARALYLKGDDAAADYHFRQAQAGKVPPAVLANISRFRHAIDQRRRWSASFEIGLAPDTNVNAATDDETVDIFGLPFTLDKQARESSGVGITAGGTLALRNRFRPDAAILTRVAARHTDYDGSDFDDTAVSLDMGPSLDTPSVRLRPAILGTLRWFGHDLYLRSIGGGLGLESLAARRTGWRTFFDVRRNSYPGNPELTGTAVSLAAELLHPLGPASYAFTSLSLARENARAEPYANVSARLGAGYGRDFSGGLTVIGFVEAGGAWHDEPFAAFGKTRKDQRWRASLNVARRDWQLAGFSPVLRYSFVRNDSNIPVYDYTRHRVEIVISRLF